MDERRSSKRWRTVLKARIYLADTSELPATFELEIPNRGLRVQGCVVWSRGANHGVMFRERVKAWTDAARAAVA